MDFELNEEQQQVKMSVREFAEGEIAPHVREWDEKQKFPAELLPKMAAQGFMGVIFPEEYASLSSISGRIHARPCPSACRTHARLRAECHTPPTTHVGRRQCLCRPSE